MTTRQPFLVGNGHPVAVLRPDDADLALQLGRRARETNDALLLQALIKAQPYTFVGWASGAAAPDNVNILDHGGRPVDTLRGGDSFFHGARFAGLRPGSPVDLREVN